jgi:hypothetical protein
MDAYCTSEFGASYQAASVNDVLSHWESLLSTPALLPAGAAGFVAQQVSGLNGYLNVSGGVLNEVSVVSGTFPVACVRLDSVLRFTRTVTATPSDATCTAAFGASAREADIRDVLAFWRTTLTSGGAIPSQYFYARQGAAGASGAFYITTSGALFYDSGTGFSAQVACTQAP